MMLEIVGSCHAQVAQNLTTDHCAFISQVEDAPVSVIFLPYFC
jgi:hypothetical protein